MKTVEEVIVYLELELAEAYEMYDLTKGVDAQEARIHLIKATTILNLLEAIK